MTVDALARFDATVTRTGTVMQPNGDPCEAEGVLNPAGVRVRDGRYLLYPRCVAEGNVSRVGMAHAVAGSTEFARLGYALEPEAPYELRVPNSGGMGCEDPRVTFVPVLDRFVMAYTAFGPTGPRIAVALSGDGIVWQRVGLVDFAAHGLPVGDDKDGAFFPEPVFSPAGVLSLAFYHRPMLKLSTANGVAAVPTILTMPPEDRECTRIAYVPLDAVIADIHNLLVPHESVLVLAPDGAWGRIKTGSGTPPVRIDEGWFSIYHAVDAEEIDGRWRMTYSAGFVVHDIDRPQRILYRSAAPILAPESVDERRGIVNNVVFPTAIDVLGDRSFDVYYGMADSRIGRVRVDLAPAFAAAGETAA